MKKSLLAFVLSLLPSLLQPTPALAQLVSVSYQLVISPAQASLGVSGSQQFSAPVTSSGGSVVGGSPSVTWSINPSVGSISAAGLYTAPAAIASEQWVIVTATAGPMVASGVVTLVPAAQAAASAIYSLFVTPAQATLAASGTQQFTAPISSNASFGSPTVAWSISPEVGSVSSTGLYTAPGSIAAAQTVTVSATSGTLVASATVQLTPPPVITLPIQIMGPNGTSKSVTFNVPPGTSAAGPLVLQMQIHNLKYETEASVQLNGGTWIPINTPNTTRGGLADTFGGIGGGFATLNLTMSLPAGAVVAGSNTVSFEFLATNGITSGYSVLSFNVTSNGTQLIPASTFAYDNPANWTPPLNDPADIAAGQTLWQTATLTSPMAIKAHCSDCHTVDGRDLKYFNYSNYSIEARSQFHGLTAVQGQQIASYIRSLNAPAPASAAPWNPPYQPGPGLHSQPVANWAAGAGLGAVAASDAAMVANAMPGGSTTAWAQNAYFDQENYPIYFQLLDWNRWLPTTHPMDSTFGTQFLASALYSAYNTIRTTMAAAPTLAAAQALYLGQGPAGVHGTLWPYWLSFNAALYGPLQTSANMSNATFQAQYYASHEWLMVKHWEFMQQYSLEGLGPQVFKGTSTTDRAWPDNAAFFTGPGISGMPRPSAGLGNGTAAVEIYHSFAWYQLQLILNDGNLTGGAVDWPYAIGYPTNDWAGMTMTAGSPNTGAGTAGLLIEWLVKALQNDILNSYQNPAVMVEFPAQIWSWAGITQAQKVAVMTAFTQAWFNYFGAMTPAQYQTWTAVGSTFSPDPTQDEAGQFLIYGLPQLAYWGVPMPLLTQIANWAATIWPTYPWASDLAEKCAVRNGANLQVGCAAPTYTYTPPAAPAN